MECEQSGKHQDAPTESGSILQLVTADGVYYSWGVAEVNLPKPEVEVEAAVPATKKL